MIALAAALLLAHGQTSLTLTTRGETVGKLLKDASKICGVPMEATSAVSGEIVIVSVNNVPVPTFQANLAKAIGAGWRTSGSTQYLARTAEQERSQEAAERAANVKEIAAGLAKFKEKAAAQTVFDANTAQSVAAKYAALYTKYKGHLGDSPGLEASMALTPEMPHGRLAMAAVSYLTADQLADVGAGGRIVYSTKPTAVQRRLPDGVIEAGRRYAAEQALYVAALKRQPDSEKLLRYLDSQTTAEAEPAMIVMATERSPYNPSLTVRIKLVGADGTILDESSTLFETPGDVHHLAPLSTEKIDMSENSSRFYKGYKQLEAGKTFIDDKTLIELLLNPEKVDPLSYLAADGLLGLAGQKNLIACVPDDAFLEPVATCVDKDAKLDLSKFSDYFSGNSKLATEGNWLVVSPLKMVETRSMRVDRAAEGAFFRKCVSGGGPSVEDLAEFVSKMPKLYMETLAPATAFFAYPPLNAAISDRNVEFLRVYGRLTPQQRLALKSGTALQVGVLNEASKADLNWLAFRADSPVSISFMTKPGEPPDAHPFKIDTEITVALPNGVPDTADLTMMVNSSDAVMIDGGTTNYAQYEALSAWSLAYALAAAQRADPTDKRQQFRVDKYRFVKSTNINFELTLTRNCQAQAECKLTASAPNNASVPYDQLPDSFKQAVAQAMDSVRKQLDAREKTKTGVPPP